MSGAGEAIEGVVALLFGGLLFILIGSRLAQSTSTPLVFDLRLWGGIYILGAFVLAGGVLVVLLMGILGGR